MKQTTTHKSGAFTLVELVIVMAVITILAGLLLPQLAVSRHRSHRIPCVNNLKQVGLAFRIFATDHQDKYPMAISTNLGGASETWSVELGQPIPLLYLNFTCLSNELGTPRILTCPSDTGRTWVTNFQEIMNRPQAKNKAISYFVGKDADETRPQMLLAGDRNVTNNAPDSTPVLPNHPQSVLARFGTNAGAGFSATIHQNAGNAALADGSVQQFTSSRLREQLRYSKDPLGHNTLGIPGENPAP